MALNDLATFKPSTGRYFTAAVGTDAPVDPLAPGVAWTEIGHTSLEDILSITSEGGEPTVLGTLQKKNLRTSYSARSETLAFTLQQFDEPALKLYYGSNATVLPNGLLAVPNNPVPTTTAFLAVFEDGENSFPFWAPKSEIFRGDDLALADTESLAGLPLTVKPLNYNTNTFAYAVGVLGGV